MNSNIKERDQVGRAGFIYFIEHDQAFKVGFSIQPEKRLSELQTANYLRLTLIGQFPATYDFEQLFHREFLHCSFGNEWYPLTLKTSALHFVTNFKTLHYCEPKPKLHHLAAVDRSIFKRKRLPIAENDPRFISDTDKVELLRRVLDFDILIESGKLFHWQSEELRPLIKFGSRAVVCNFLGFGIPTIIKGPNKGKPDVIRYLGRILELFDCETTGCKRRENGKILNYYRITKRSPD